MNLRTKITIALYVVVYFIICFIRWEIYNPIDTIKWLGTLSRDERGLFLFMYLDVSIALHAIIFFVTDELKRVKESK